MAKSRISQGTTHLRPSHSPNRFCSSSSSISNLVTRPAPVLALSTGLGRPVSSVVRLSPCDHRQHSQKSSARPLSSAPKKKTCSCSPSTHPGSFRCSLHRNSPVNTQEASYRSSNQQLHMRRSAMTNSLVRIGTVEGDLVKRALASLIRPSSHNQRRRENLQPRPSRLSVMSNAQES